MKNLEATEVRGVSIKQMLTYVGAILAFVVGLVYRDVSREKEIENYKLKIQTLEIRMEAADKERAALRAIDNIQENRLTKIETIVDYLKQK